MAQGRVFDHALSLHTGGLGFLILDETCDLPTLFLPNRLLSLSNVCATLNRTEKTMKPDELLDLLDLLFALGKHGSDNCLNLFNILWTGLFEQLQGCGRETSQN